MNPLILAEILAIFSLILANGFFAGAEIALVAANRARLRDWAERGDRGARLALELAENPGRFLPTVQLGITLIGTLAAAFSGATIVEALEGRLAGVRWAIVANARSEIALAAVVLALTAVSIVVGELVPKQLALHNATGVARFMAPSIHRLSRMARPVVWLMGSMTSALMRLLGAPRGGGETTTVLEIRQLIELGLAEGSVGQVERQLALEALALRDRTVRQIMKPRIDIDAIDARTAPETLLGVIAMAGFSRLPVYDNDLDHVIGFVHLKDVLRQHYMGWKLDLKHLVRPALIVPETMRLDQLLVRFQKERNQLAIVVDEFGATRGMVTLEDVLEELVGELLTEHHQRVEQQIVARAPGSWLVDGTVSLADFFDSLGRADLRSASPRHVTSVAGLVLEALGRFPKVGEQVRWRDLQLEVVDLDGRRIDKVLVTLKPAPDQAGGA